MRFSWVLTLLLAGVCHAEPTWNAAAARTKITPDTMMWMAGYASRIKPAEGTALDLYAKALLIEDGQGHQLAIITMDLIGVPRSLHVNVACRAEKEFGIKPAFLLINASHTHSAPELISDGDEPADEPNRRVDEARSYTHKVEDQIVAMIGDCRQRMQPARLQYSFARCGFAMNRRTPTPKGYTNHPYPPGPVNHEVPVLRVTDAAGKEIALAFGYNCHNTTLALLQFNGDYAGYAQQNLETAHPRAVALFVNGCSGDQNPYPRGTVALAQTHGRSLASAVDAALTTDMQDLTGNLRGAYEEIPLAYSPTPTAEQLQQRQKSADKLDAAYATRLLGILKKRGSLADHYPYPVQVLRIGDQLTMITLGGEVVVDYSLRFKSEIKDPIVWTAGYSNDVMAYIPSLRILKEGGYEAGDSMKWGTNPCPWSEKTEEHIVSTVERLRKSLE